MGVPNNTMPTMSPRLVCRQACMGFSKEGTQNCHILGRASHQVLGLSQGGLWAHHNGKGSSNCSLPSLAIKGWQVSSLFQCLK